MPNARREFDRALGQHVVTFVAEDPVGVLRRFQRITHRIDLRVGTGAQLAVMVNLAAHILRTKETKFDPADTSDV